MSHHIYQTDGFILKSREAKDANRFYSIFTRDLGLIGATAQGVRFLKSKLRYSLHSYAYSHLSLVRGKEVWRITSAGRIDNIYTTFGKEKEPFMLVARIFTLLERLLTGEEKNEPLFDSIKNLIIFLKSDSFSPDEIRSIETIAAMQILFFLGYFLKTEQYEKYLDGCVWDKGMLDDFVTIRPQAIASINSALKDSQL